MKTSELTGAALDWAVAKCEGHDISINKTLRYTELRSLVLTDVCDDDWTLWQPSIDWAQGGPIIERESINLNKEHDGIHAVIMEPHGHDWTEIVGSTPLIAAMRCYVASKLGDEVDVPKELL